MPLFTIKNAVKLLVAAPLFMLTLEICARIDDMVRYNAPLIGEYNWDKMLSTVDEYGRTGKPNGRFQNIRLNTYGFRGEMIEPIKGKDVCRVACIGASETFGYMEQPGYEWPAQLSMVLNAKGTKHYEVINAAFPGRGLHSSIFHLEKRVMKFHPDIVILYSALYSYMNPRLQENREKSEQAEQSKPDNSEEKGLDISLRPRILSKIKQLIKGLLPKPLLWKYQEYVGLSMLRDARAERTYDYFVDDASPINLQIMKEDLNGFQSLCEKNNAQLIIATHASYMTRRNLIGAWRFMPYFTEEGFRKADMRLNEKLVEFAKENNILYVDIADLVPKDEAHMADFTHFTDAGSEIVAKAFAQAIFSLDAEKSGDIEPLHLASVSD